MKLFRIILLGLLVFRVSAVGTAQTGGNTAPEAEKITGNADKDSVKLGRVVVTATKTEVREAETGASVTIITGEEIEKKGKRYVVDVLKEVPGVTVSRSGSVMYVFLRGSGPGNTLVMIDGIRINDPMSIDNAFDFSHFPVESIERIEIIYGPQSTLYGSDASGGVINIITKKGSEKHTINVSAEAGSYMTFRETLSLTGKLPWLEYAMGFSRMDTGGYSAIKHDSTISGDPDRDPSADTSFYSKLGFQLPWDIKLNCAVHYSYADFEIDDWSNDDDLNRTDTSSNVAARMAMEQGLFPWYDYLLSVDYHGLKRTDQDRNDANDTSLDRLDSWYRGSDLKTEWQNNFTIQKIDTITAGLSYLREWGSQHYDHELFGLDDIDTKTISTSSLYLQNHIKYKSMIFHTAGIRYDYHNMFGNQFTWQTSLSIVVPVVTTRIHGSYGTGFKAPTIYQLYVNNPGVAVGDPGLKPEKNSNYDAGIEQPFFDDKVNVEAIYFDNRYTHMITYNFPNYYNQGKSSMRGIETKLKLKAFRDILVTAGYTYMETRDDATGDELLKRPKHKASVNLDWIFIEGGDFNATFNYIGQRKESTTVTLDGYYTIDLSASYWIFDWLQAFIRIENLANTNYVEYTGYTTPGISVYGGLKGRLEFSGDEEKEKADL